MSTLKNFSGAVANKKRQAGLALLEMIIAIGILGVISAAVVMLSTKAFSSMNVKDAVNGLTTLDSAIKTAYRNKGNYKGIAEQANPDNPEDQQIIERQLLRSPFGGYYDLKVLTANAKPDRGFLISMTGLNSEQCVKVIESLGNSFRYVGTKEIADITKPGEVGKEGVVVANGQANLDPVYVKSVCKSDYDTLHVGNS